MLYVYLFANKKIVQYTYSNLSYIIFNTKYETSSNAHPTGGTAWLVRRRKSSAFSRHTQKTSDFRSWKQAQLYFAS